MTIPVKQALKVGAYVAKQRLKGVERYPLVLMLEPLYQCNLACAGCGKIQQPDEILKMRLSPEQCWAAADECGAPVVSIPGGEPLIHPEIHTIVQGLIERGKFVYLCTNAILLEKKLPLFKPSPYLTFSVHIDGLRERHDESVCREGIFDVAVGAIKAAQAKGFRVTTNTTIFDGEQPAQVRQMFDYLSEIGVDGMMISPGYAYAKAAGPRSLPEPGEDAGRCSGRFWKSRRRGGRSITAKLFLDFLKGEIEYDCTPWGNPTYSVLGWQRPCYLLDEGFVETFEELIEETDWSQYGTREREPEVPAVHGALGV